MAGRTGYTALTNGDTPDFGPDVTKVYEHFDALIGETVTTASALPAASSFAGRTVWVQDENTFRVSNGSSWVGAGNVLSPLSPSGWTVTGDIEVTRSGSKQKVNYSLVLTRSGSGTTVSDSAYLNIGVVIPVAARFGSGGDEYFAAEYWNTAQWEPGVIGIARTTGEVLMRSSTTAISMSTGGFVTLRGALFG